MNIATKPYGWSNVYPEINTQFAGGMCGREAVQIGVDIAAGRTEKGRLSQLATVYFSLPKNAAILLPLVVFARAK